MLGYLASETLRNLVEFRFRQLSIQALSSPNSIRIPSSTMKEPPMILNHFSHAGFPKPKLNALESSVPIVKNGIEMPSE